MKLGAREKGVKKDGDISKYSIGTGVWPTLQPVQQSILDDFVTRMKDAIVENWNTICAAVQGKTNTTKLDKEAMLWLKQESQRICIIEADKNLGIAVCTRDWVHQQVYNHLRKYRRVEEHEYIQLHERMLKEYRVLIDYAVGRRLITKGIERFLLQSYGTDRPGVFRINVKVHKCPIESRPLSNLRGTLPAPSALILNEALRPIQSLCTGVLESTGDLVQIMQNRVLQPNEVLFTFDIASLYPSLLCRSSEGTKALFFVVKEAIYEFYAQKQGKWAYASFLTSILRLNLECAFVEYDNKVYLQTEGLTTGFSAASTAANIYLSRTLDKHILAHVKPTLLVRYIDDGGGIIDDDCAEFLYKKLNDWDTSLVIKRKDFVHGKKVHILDVELEADHQGTIHMRTYRKAVNAYDYLSPDSAHSKNVCEAIIHGECFRLLLTNSSQDSYQYQLKFFESKLKDRGYEVKKVRAIMSRYPFTKRTMVLARINKKTEKPVKKQTLGVISTRFIKGIDSVAWNKVFKKAELTLQKRLNTEAKLRFTYSVGKNLFRKLYPTTWKGREGT